MYSMYMFNIDMLLAELFPFYIFQKFSNILFRDLTIILTTILPQYVKGLIVATARKLQGIYQLDIVLKIAGLICAYNTQS